MKGTAKLYGMRVDSWVDERRDPYRATDAAARHLRDLNRAVRLPLPRGGRLQRRLGRVSRGLRTLPTTTTPIRANADAMFFRLYDTKLLRRETKDYVPKLIAAALIAKEPARYGFTVTAAEPPITTRMVVPTMTGLDVIARLADTDRRRDPRAESAVPPSGDAAGDRVGGASARRVGARPRSPRTRSCRRRSGSPSSSTSSAAVRPWAASPGSYRVSSRLLQDANPRVNPRHASCRPAAGVPTGGAISSTWRATCPIPKPAAGTSTSGYHRVRWGETLSEIADEYGVSQRDLSRGTS